MKKILLTSCITFMALYTQAQNGLECVSVEKYYIADANDASGSVGTLPVGSVTYRIFADLLPGYKFQAAYGVPGHELSIKTTTSFFNNEDRGATTANAIPKTALKSNTVMLDSWLSVGAASGGTGINSYFGIPKEDDTSNAPTVINSNSLLQNADPLAGQPLTARDGLLPGTATLSPQTVTTVGIDNDISVFDATSQAGNAFITSNGSWASLNGSVGPNADNKVLIAQITTDGKLTFELNIQIGTPSGGVENYVAKDAVANEIVLSCLTYPQTIGINNNQNETSSAINLFPNPAGNLTHLQLLKGGNTAYTIYNTNGKIIAHKELGAVNENHTETIEMSAFANGLYFIQVTNANNTSYHKIIKE